MKNFYEILEINEKASPEIVEKAYKVLVKKYHPDLQTDPQKKQECEAKIKEINEAYETLSNEDLRAEYDNQLKQEQNQYEHPIQSEQHNQNNKTNIHEMHRKQQEYRQNQEQARQQYEEQYKNAINKAYHDAYVKRLKDMGYKIKYKKTPKQKLQTIIAIIITIAIIFLICQIPFVQDYFKNLYEENSVIKWIVDLIINLFNKK